MSPTPAGTTTGKPDTPVDLPCGAGSLIGSARRSGPTMPDVSPAEGGPRCCVRCGQGEAHDCSALDRPVPIAATALHNGLMFSECVYGWKRKHPAPECDLWGEHMRQAQDVMDALTDWMAPK